MNALLLALAVSAFAAAPPSDDAGPDAAAVKTAAQAQIQAVNAYMGIPVEPARVDALSAAADGVTQAGNSCSSTADNAAVRRRAPGDFVDAALSGPESVERRAEAALALDGRFPPRLVDARRGVQELQAAADKAKAEKPKDEKTQKLQDAADRAQAALKTAEDDEAALEALAAQLGEPREEVRRRGAHAKEARAALAVLVPVIDSLAAALGEPAATLKARLGTLGKPPEAENRTRVYAAVDPLLDPARTIYARTISAGDELERFRDGYRMFSKGFARFEELLKSLAAQRDALERDLAAAERLVADGRALLTK